MIYPGDPDAIVRVNDTGSGGVFQVVDGGTVFIEADPSASIVRVSGSDLRWGDGIHELATTFDAPSGYFRNLCTDRLSFGGVEIRLGARVTEQDATILRVSELDTSANPTDRAVVEYLSPQSEVVLATPQPTDSLRIRAVNATGGPNFVTIQGQLRGDFGAEFAGDVSVGGTLQVTSGTLALAGDLSVGANLTVGGEVIGPVTVGGAAPELELTDGSDSVVISLDGASLRHQVGANVLWNLSSFPSTPRPTSTLQAPPSTDVGIFADAIRVGASTVDIVLEGPSAFLRSTVDDVTVQTADIFEVVGSGSGTEVIRVFSGPGGAGGRIDVFGPGGAAGGAQISLLGDNAANVASVTVGDGSAGIQGRLIARARQGGVNDRPGLVGLEADDGTMTFLAVWEVNAGVYQLKISDFPPTSSSDGVNVGPTFP